MQVDPQQGMPMWRPVADREMLRLRAGLLAGIRAFFNKLDVMEVETPILSHAGNPDIYIESFSSKYQWVTVAQPLYLQTSPEFAMKRLLAAGSGSIYQICKAFRNEQPGRLHNPEFTLLEWYRSGFDHHQLMQEIEQLLVFIGLLGKDESIKTVSYQSLFENTVGLNPHVADEQMLFQCISDNHIQLNSRMGLEKDDLLALILTHVIEPSISHEAFLMVYDYPASQASLAKIREDDYPVAERFELYAGGIELANGFHELTDSKEQAQRFLQQQRKRASRDQDKINIDQYLIDALAYGMESCAGVAMGFDRLVMVAANKPALQEVLAFPFDRA